MSALRVMTALTLATAAAANVLESELMLEPAMQDTEDGEYRLLFANYTSSLLPVNSTLLLLAAAALAGLAGLAWLLFTFLTSQNSSGGSYGSYGQSTYGQGYAGDSSHSRSARDTSDSDWIRVLTLLDVATKIYTNMSSDQMKEGCPTKLVCEFFEQPDVFGRGAGTVSRMMNFLLTVLQPLTYGIPYVSQFVEAADINRSEDLLTCDEKYNGCDVSLQRSFKENFESVRDARLELVWK